MEPISKFAFTNEYAGNLKKDIEKLRRYETIFKIQKDRILQEEDLELIEDLKVSNEHLEVEINLLTKRLERFM